LWITESINDLSRHPRFVHEVELVQQIGPWSAVSHQSAARVWGIELVEPGGEHVTVPRNRGRVHLPGWTVHRADLASDEVEMRGDIRATTPVRTVLDLARLLPFAQAVVAADSALRQSLFSLEVLLSTVAAVVGRGAGRVRALGSAVDPASGSVLESMLRVLLVGHGLGPTYTQWPILDGERFIARVDFAWPAARLVVEADGFAYHSDRASYRHDRERLNDLERLGWRVLRFTWEDVVGRPDYVVAMVRAVLEGAA
jgi:very-short-patch-repair endonuclease